MRNRLPLVTKKVRTGDLVRISITLKSHLNDRVFVSAWTRGIGDEHFGPHVPAQILARLEDEPRMISPPARWALSATKRSMNMEFISDCDMHYRLCQETDLSDKSVITVKVRRYGKIAQAIRRFCRATLRRIGRGDAQAERDSRES